MYGSSSIFSISPSYRFLCVFLLWLWVPAVGIKPFSSVLFKNNFPLLLPRTEDDLNSWMSPLPSAGGERSLPAAERRGRFSSHYLYFLEKKVLQVFSQL